MVERDCPDCRGRQVVTFTRSGTAFWICTDTECNRTDDVEDGRYVSCENCGKIVDTHTPGVWKAPNDEQWWHEDCYDKIEKAKEVREALLPLIPPEDEWDGYSDEFHEQLDGAQAALKTAIDRERVRIDAKATEGRCPQCHDDEFANGADPGETVTCDDCGFRMEEYAT